MLAENGTDFPWVIVVMMFIAFVQWIMGKLRGTEDVLPDATLEEELPPPANRPRQTASAPPPIPPAQPQSAPTTPTTLQEWRRLLEAMKEAQVETNKPPPPPAPKRVAPSPPPPIPIQAPASSPPPRVTTARTATKTTASDSGTLRITPKSIRDAVILKEILDPPLSLRDGWDR